ncbi:hypothetical protein GN157_01445 [Flavobacterium rakeshii]|uniref:Uncharacterized protein n=1 Tax=Flavobacterium rakeshii TaxID=1038845 RepID=A0A6N8HCZ6_9FLAO|nr:hypothetical protein [Flavobacterium rakeshii]MUV02358.1 hypothetical protein [Flavobacterium rakeshii]
MKKFIYGLLGFAAISLTSCDYHDPNGDKFGNDPSIGWVQFKSEDISYGTATPGAESTITASVPVVIKSLDIIDLGGNEFENNPVNDGLTVYYTVEDIDGSSSFINIPGSVYIPKGELSANITFTVPATAQISCTQFKVTLTSTSNANVTVGFEDHDIPTHEFLVGAYDLNAMVGTYNALRDGQEQYQCSIVLGEEPNSLIVNNIYGIDPNSQTTIYVNEGGIISFPEYTSNFLFVNGSTSIYVEGFDGLSTCLNGGSVSLNFRLRSATTVYADNTLELIKQ